METGRLGATRAVFGLTTQDSRLVNIFKNAFRIPITEQWQFHLPTVISST